jgi:hypothetical protein
MTIFVFAWPICRDTQPIASPEESASVANVWRV